MQHAIKIEQIDITKEKADLMVETFKDILLDLGFSEDRIDAFECRSRDGFIPHSHNKGGIHGICFTQNRYLLGSGYDYGDGIIQKWDERQNEFYEQDHRGKYRYINQVQSGKRKESELYQKVLDHYYEYIDGCSEYDATMFEVRFMVLQDGTIDVDVFGCTSDAPYFRGSDYNKYNNFTFKDADSFKKEVMEFLDTCDCVDLIDECY